MDLTSEQVEKTIRVFDGNAQTYGNKIEWRTEVIIDYAPKVENFLNYFSRSSSVLFIGSGTGRDCAIAQDLGFENIYGIDISYQMLLEANKRKTGNNLINANVLNMPLPANSIHVIMADSVLAYVSNKILVPCLKEINRVLNPSGTALLYFKEGENTHVQQDTLLGLERYYMVRKIEDIREAVLQANFDIKNIEYDKDSFERPHRWVGFNVTKLDA